MKPNSDYESLDDYFRNLRGKIENAKNDYPKLESVVKGETTLVDIVNGYESRFYQLLNNKTVLLDKIRIRKLQDEVVKYGGELEQFMGMMNCISEQGTDSPPIEGYLKETSDRLNKRITWSMYFGGMGAMFLSVIFPPTMIIHVLLYWLGWGTMWSGAFSGNPFKRVGNKGKINAESFFKGLLGSAQTLDKELRSAYAIDYFMHDRDLFKEVYNGLDKPKKDYVDTKLAQMQELGALDMSDSELESFLERCVNEGNKE